MKKILLQFAFALCSISAFGQIGINTSSPDKNSMLDITSSNKGLLIPRVNLTAASQDLNGDGDNNIANQPAGLMVYNIGTTFSKGFYFWNGSEWRNVDNSTSVPPSVSNIICANSTLYPKSYTAGVAYSGTLTIPYSGGNGGSYTGGNPITVNGLTFTLQAGKLNVGSGSLSFSVSGNNPTVSSPVATTVPINSTNVSFFTGSCNAVVGNDTSSAIENITTVMGPLVSNSDNSVAGYALSATTPDGKYSIRIFAKAGYQFGQANVQIRSNSGTPTITWQNSSTYCNVDGGVAGIWNLANNATVFPVANEWVGSDNQGLTTMNRITTSTSNYGTVAFGDQGIGDGGRVEYRRYTWTSTDTTDKTMYDVNIMMGAPDMSKVTNATNCPSGVCSSTKGFIKISQMSSN